MKGFKTYTQFFLNFTSMQKLFCKECKRMFKKNEPKKFTEEIRGEKLITQRKKQKSEINKDFKY